MKNIGFIGIGVMGKSMVRNLIKRVLQFLFIQEQNKRHLM